METGTTIDRPLPTGTVTFFFSDVEGSTGLLQRLASGYRDVIERHAQIIRGCLAAFGGTEVSTEGDSFFAVFTSSADAVAASSQVQLDLAAEPWPPGGTVAVRIGLHTGTGELGHDNYVGIDVNRAARISAAGHGGQVVVSETVRVLAQDAAFSDLGEHKLKGLDKVEHLYQLEVPGLAQTFPPLRTESSRPNNLPALASRIVGRESELARLEQLMSEARLVTIIGPGGIGKTRLALEVAGHLLTRFERGAFLVDLTPVEDEELVMPAISTAVGAAQTGDQSLAAALCDGPRLLLLDNFERVVGAGRELSALIEGAPPLKVLVTSQLPLRLNGEHVFRLEPLPSGGDSSAAIELFVARARQADPAFDLDAHRGDVARLVAALNGIPLAIELAAARMNVLSPGQVLERLGSGFGVLDAGRSDAPDRHRSIRAAIEWSYDLLTASQKELIQALAVFRGGSTIDALQHVAETDPIDDLAELVDRSLVQAETGTVGKRFDLLAPVQLYVESQMPDARPLESRHTQFFTELAISAREPLEGDSRARWLAALKDDQDNLRATLDRLLAVGAIEQGFEILGCIWRFFHSTNQLGELGLWLERFFGDAEGAGGDTESAGGDAESAGGDAEDAGGDTRARCLALLARGSYHYWRGDWSSSASDYQAAWGIAEALGDRPLIAESLLGLSAARGNAMAMGEPIGDPRDPADRAYEIATELGDTAMIASIETGNILVASLAGPEIVLPDRAGLRRIIDLYRRAGRTMLVAHTQMMLAGVDFMEQKWEEARRNALVALETAELAGDSFTIAAGIRWLGAAIVRLGDPRFGARIAGAAEAAHERMGGTWPMNPFFDDKAEDVARELIGSDADAEFEAGRALTLGEALRQAKEWTGPPKDVG